MSGTKFFIFGGGRWREVSVEDGYIEGWGKSRFAYRERGTMKMAKTRSVLSGLRDLKDGIKNGTVRDGIHLVFKKLEVTSKKEEKQTDMGSCNYGGKCQHTNNNGCQPEKKIPFKELSVGDKTDVGIQTSQTPQAIVYPDSKKLSLKKCRNTVSSTENKSPTTITTEAIVHTSPKKISKLGQEKRWSLASEELSSKQKVPSSKFQKEDSTKYDLYRRKRSDSSDSLIWVVMPKDTDVKSTKSQPKQVTKSKRNARRKSMSVSSSEEFQPKLKKRRKSASDAVIKDKDVEKIVANISTTSDDEDSIAIKSKTKSINKSLNDTQSTDNLRELNISESDVEVIRNYLINTRPDFDLLRFDADDNYKVQFFYTINPLVNVERCSKITRILRRDSQEEIRLKDFASQLGLKSISETSAPQRYKMRNTKERRNLNRTSYVSDSEINTRNIKKQKVGKGNNSRSDFSDSDFERATDSEDVDVRRKTKSNNKDHKLKTLRKNTSKKNMSISDKSSDRDSSSVVESKIVILRKRKSRAVTIDLSLIDSESDKKSSQNKNDKKKDDDKIKTLHLTNNDLKNINKSNNNTFESNPKAIKSAKKDDIKEDKINNSKTEQIDRKKENSNLNVSRMSRDRDGKCRYKKERNVSTNKNADDKAKSSKKLSAKNPSKKNDSGSEYYSSDLEEDTFTTKHRNRRQNKTIDSDTQKNNISRLTRSAKDKSNSETRKNYISENTNETSNVKNSRNSKRKLNIDTTSTNTKEKVQNKVSYHDDTTETINLSSDSEDEELTKKTLTEKIGALTANQNRPGSSTSSYMRAVPYSNLEDHAIVSWVSCGSRARCVNGNRIWQQLQDQYYSISGQHRTWHSLRNRYLRHILPGLGLLSLKPSQVSRLRAAAATGEIKCRNKIHPRRNSIFGAVTSGALSRRPRAELSSESDNEFAAPAKRHKHDGRTKSPPPTTRVLRSSLPTSSDEKPAHSPRYSDITRKFAAKHRYESTPNTSPSKEKQSPERDRNKKLSLVRDSPRDKNNSPDREISRKNSNKEVKNRSSPERSSMRKNKKMSPDREVSNKIVDKDNSKRNLKKSLREREINKKTDGKDESARNDSDVNSSDTDIASEIENETNNTEKKRKSVKLSKGSRKKVLCKITRRKSLSDKSDSSAEFTKASPINLRRKSMRESVRDLNEDSRSKKNKDRGKGRKLFNPKTL